MPGGDGTGPMGMGPMSGHGAGCCAGYPAPGFMNQGGGQGFCGRGFGGRGHGGHGHRNRFRATGLPGWARAGWGGLVFDSTLPRDMQIQALERQAEYFHGALDEIQKRREERGSAHAADTGDKK
jgi:hypothetical protein